MQNTDSIQNNDKPKDDLDTKFRPALVDLSDPKQVGDVFKHSNGAGQQEGQQSDHLTFDDPYKNLSSDNQFDHFHRDDDGQGWGRHMGHGRGRETQPIGGGQAASDLPSPGDTASGSATAVPGDSTVSQNATSTLPGDTNLPPAATTLSPGDANVSTAGSDGGTGQTNLSPADQALLSVMQALETEVQQFQAEMAQILAQLAPAETQTPPSSGAGSEAPAPSATGNGGDSGAPTTSGAGSDSTTTASGAGSDSATTTTSGAGSDSATTTTSGAGSDSATTTTSGAGSDSATTTTSGAASDSTAPPTTGTQNDSSTPVSSASGTDSSTPATTSGGSDSTTTASSSTGANTTTPSGADGSAATQVVTAPSGNLVGDNISEAGSLPTSSNAFIADLQMDDPVMAKTLTDASSQMSSSGYTQVLNSIQTAYTAATVYGQGNWDTGNPNFDANMAASALNIQGLSAADQSAFKNVLQTDMPAALASDPFVASIQQSDPALAKVLTDAKSQLSSSGYYALEGQIQTYYSGNPNEATPLPDQTFLDNYLMSNAGGDANLSQSDATALKGILQQDMPGAESQDIYKASLQQTGDTQMVNVLTAAQSNMSAAGYTQLENYLVENSTWDPSNDASLINTALSQGGLTSSDQAALTSVLQSDMPDALTDTPSATAQQEMAQAKFNYFNEYSLVGFSHPSAIAGNPGKTGTGGTNDDQEPVNVDKIGPWAAITPINPDSYDKNAVATISDPTVYFHLKTGGWVEEEGPGASTPTSYWEGNYNNNFTANVQGDGTVNSDGSFSFTAPPSDMPVDHFGTNTLDYNPALYNGVYETMQAKVNVANSGLGMNLGADYYQTAGGSPIRQGAETNWVPLTTTNQTLSLTDMSQSAIEADPPPGF